MSSVVILGRVSCFATRYPSKTTSLKSDTESKPKYEPESDSDSSSSGSNEEGGLLFKQNYVESSSAAKAKGSSEGSDSSMDS